MSYYQKCLDSYSRGLIGFNTLAILFQSCLGSAAAMMVLRNGTDQGQMIQLFFTVMSCMIFNGSVLAQQKPKLIFNLLLASIIINTTVIILNLTLINKF